MHKYLELFDQFNIFIVGLELIDDGKKKYSLDERKAQEQSVNDQNFSREGYAHFFP